MTNSDITADDVRFILIMMDLTQEELARMIGTNAGTVSRWQRGVSKPRRIFARKLREMREVIDKR